MAIPTRAIRLLQSSVRPLKTRKGALTRLPAKEKPRPISTVRLPEERQPLLEEGSSVLATGLDGVVFGEGGGFGG